MQRNLTIELDSLLSQYLTSFIRLRPGDVYPGSLVVLSEYEKIKDATDADVFFGKYGVGNATLGADRPLERMQAYELFLYILQTYDPDKFKIIHKGTPYYFIAWTAFQFANFENSLFYMDAAVSEDNRLQTTKLTPATAFFLLENFTHASGFITLHTHIVRVISNSVKTYSLDSKHEFDKDEFVNKFIKPILYGEIKYRSVITCLYLFVLEYDLYQNRIFLRSSEGGSVDVFINHLFKGVRVLESILAMKGSGNDLAGLINNLPALGINSNSFIGGRKEFTDAKKTFEDLKNKENFQTCSFAASYIIRNTAGHSLLWEDEFDRDSYEVLYLAIVNSILWSVYKLWIKYD